MLFKYLLPVFLFAVSALFLFIAANKSVLSWLVQNVRRKDSLHLLLARMHQDSKRGVDEEILWGVAILAGIGFLVFGLVFLLVSIVEPSR